MALPAHDRLKDVRPSLGDEASVALLPVVSLLIALWICLEALQVPFGSFRMPGAGFFPLLLGMLLGLLALVLLGMGFFGNPGEATPLNAIRPEIFALIGAIFATGFRRFTHGKLSNLDEDYGLKKRGHR